MNWILEHLQLVILVGGAIAYWVNQRRKAKAETEEAMRELEAQQAQPQMPVNDEAERVRRIQEEIRRKILERAGGGLPKPRPLAIPVEEAAPPPMPAPAPALAQTQSRTDAYAESSAEDQVVSLDQAILERQQQLAEQLRELDEKRRHVVGNAEAFAEKTAAVMAASDTAVRGSLLADLRSPVAARRAIVMREVLGTPVGLR